MMRARTMLRDAVKTMGVGTVWFGRGWCGAVVLLLGGAPRFASTSRAAEHLLIAHPATANDARAVPTAGQEGPRTLLLVVSGVSGEKRLGDAFHSWARSVATAATARFGVADSLVVVLSEDSTRAGIRARSTRENVLRELARLSAQARPGDRLVVLLFGHGSTQENTPRFNVPGPDLTADDFRTALSARKDLAVVFVNTASASGEFVKALAAPNRTVITATRSGREQNETLFPEHFVRALTSDVADADKDARVNVLEAFLYARREVERVFEQGNRIVTEHALLDDDGDGVGHSDASDKGPDGIRARTIFFDASARSSRSADPRVAQLQAERRELEGKLDTLRARRATMTEDAYQQALEPLMVQLAEKTRALRALEGQKP